MPNLGGPNGHFKNDKDTWAAVGQFLVFILVVLFLYWLFGGFDSW